MVRTCDTESSSNSSELQSLAAASSEAMAFTCGKKLTRYLTILLYTFATAYNFNVYERFGGKRDGGRDAWLSIHRGARNRFERRRHQLEAGQRTPRGKRKNQRTGFVKTDRDRAPSFFDRTFSVGGGGRHDGGQAHGERDSQVAVSHNRRWAPTGLGSYRDITSSTGGIHQRGPLSSPTVGRPMIARDNSTRYHLVVRRRPLLQRFPNFYDNATLWK